MCNMSYIYALLVQGSIVLELYTQHAPKTCQNFLELSRMGYYDGTIFHRVIKDFMVQGGDPTGTGRGGESIFGYVSCCNWYTSGFSQFA